MATRSVVVWDESTQGDLSGSRNAPTTLTLNLGSNDLFATTQAGDLEYITFAVPAGNLLSGLFLRDYGGPDGTAFIGVQAGTTFSVDSGTAQPADLLGYTHFGPVPGNVGSDLLPLMGSGPGAEGFTSPLPADSYTFWLQQLGQPASYQLDFVMTPIPEPTMAPLYAAGLLLGAWVLGRRRR
jgi:hypothetical protein